MDIDKFYKIRDEYIENVFNKCLDAADYKALKKFLEKSDVKYGGYGGINPVKRRDLVDILEEENIKWPQVWIENMVMFEILTKTFVVEYNRDAEESMYVEAFLVNVYARKFLNLEYFKKYEII